MLEVTLFSWMWCSPAFSAFCWVTQLKLINPAESYPAREDNMHINFFFQFIDTETIFGSFCYDVNNKGKERCCLSKLRAVYYIWEICLRHVSFQKRKHVETKSPIYIINNH